MTSFGKIVLLISAHANLKASPQIECYKGAIFTSVALTATIEKHIQMHCIRIETAVPTRNNLLSTL